MENLSFEFEEYKKDFHDDMVKENEKFRKEFKEKIKEQTDWTFYISVIFTVGMTCLVSLVGTITLSKDVLWWQLLISICCIFLGTFLVWFLILMVNWCIQKK